MLQAYVYTYEHQSRRPDKGKAPSPAVYILRLWYVKCCESRTALRLLGDVTTTISLWISLRHGYGGSRIGLWHDIAFYLCRAPRRKDLPNWWLCCFGSVRPGTTKIVLTGETGNFGRTGQHMVQYTRFRDAFCTRAICWPHIKSNWIE